MPSPHTPGAPVLELPVVVLLASVDSLVPVEPLDVDPAVSAPEPPPVLEELDPALSLLEDPDELDELVSSPIYEVNDA